MKKTLLFIALCSAMIACTGGTKSEVVDTTDSVATDTTLVDSFLVDTIHID